MRNKFIFLALMANVLTASALSSINSPKDSTIAFPANTTLDAVCSDILIAGTIQLGNAVIQSVRNVEVSSSGVFNGQGASVYVAGDWRNSGSFQAGTSNIVFEDGCATQKSTISGENTFNNLTIRSTNGKGVVLDSGAVLTVLGTLTLVGTEQYPLTLSAVGDGRIVLGPNARVIYQYADITAPSSQLSASVKSVPMLNNFGILLLSILSFLLFRKTFKK